ncbi:MAG: Uma2 family endonuclease [Okeania sp. SIO3I5]|uniref:Uma2 family endonuclease n=1 Tax=Okeania sp. SIO3I5 TaxID=2607805 RepID=UPI0013B736F2|nr:Uma2 family endonuclease [Okeania sp. SIO3I5]
MVEELTNDTKPEIIYPDSDGQPIADNTKQFRWIVTIKENLESLFADVPDVFVAGDLLWYPIEGNNQTRIAPDTMVVFGRPKGDRGSYKQWEEENIAPQVVFEILSPRNTPREMMNKQLCYQNYGVEEYYIYDPDNIKFTGLIRVGERLETIEKVDGWVSPRLGIRFQLTPEILEIYRPNGRKFLTFVESYQAMQQEEERAERMAELLIAPESLEIERPDTAKFLSFVELDRAREKAEQRADKLAELLKERGIDPEQERQSAYWERQRAYWEQCAEESDKRAEQSGKRAEQQRQRAEQQRQRAEQQRQRAGRLAELLREIGVNPDQIL